MFGLIRRRRPDDEDREQSLQRSDDEPNPAVALAVGLIYVFRTSAGVRLMRESTRPIRRRCGGLSATESGPTPIAARSSIPPP
jgi:hypothetical protein